MMTHTIVWRNIIDKKNIHLSTPHRGVNKNYSTFFDIFRHFFLLDIVQHQSTFSDFFRHCSTLFNIVWYFHTFFLFDIVWYFFVQHCTTLLDIVWHCSNLFEFVWLCSTLFDIFLHCLAFSVIVRHFLTLFFVEHCRKKT